MKEALVSAATVAFKNFWFLPGVSCLFTFSVKQGDTHVKNTYTAIDEQERW